MSISNNLTEAPMATYPARARKVAPPHPGPIIGGVLEEAGVSVREAARSIGLSHTLLTQVIAGEKAVSPKTAVLLEAYFGNGPSGAQLWLDLQRDYDVWAARAELADELKAIEPLQTSYRRQR